MKSLRTVLIGLGNIGMRYADDALTAKHFRYATHAQVLNAHPGFEFKAIVDHNPNVLELAKSKLKIPNCYSSVEELQQKINPEVAVLATAPQARLEIIKKFKDLKAIIIEKPLSSSIQDTVRIVNYCQDNNILLQVNYWRRFDAALDKFKLETLNNYIGNWQVAFAIYGKGLINNGCHLIDMIRFTLGEIQYVSNCYVVRQYSEHQDYDICFGLGLADNKQVFVGCVDFTNYREISLDIWGTCGRLEILQEGLIIKLSKKNPHRAMLNANEISSDIPQILKTAASDALYQLYENLLQAIYGNQKLLSPGSNALSNETIIDNIIHNVS